MDRRFAATEWEGMSLAECVARCHVLAKEAKILAEKTSPTMRERYVHLEQEWLKLAAVFARESER
jgi:hypothetical protein